MKFFIYLTLVSVLSILSLGCSQDENSTTFSEDNQGVEYVQSEEVAIRLNYGDEKAGIVSGRTDEGHIYWKGIPYAACPTGDNRFRGPQPVTLWTGIKDTTEFGPQCHNGMSDIEDESVSEDCLYLNVFAPTTRPSESTLFPVIVYIHGGGFRSGSANRFDGKWWVEDGYDGEPVLLVTINYRLGSFGFVHHPVLTDDEQIDTAGSTLTRTDDSWGNYGIRDQIKALEWVKENIAEFGGDPDNVTIMGESAGCWSVLAHMTSPLSEGLFHKAICESQGPMINSFEHAITLGEQLLGPDYMNCTGEEQNPLQCLRDAPADAFTEAHKKFQNINDDIRYVGAVDGILYPDHPFRIFEDGLQNKVPLIIGYNEDEVPATLITAVNIKAEYDMAIDHLFKNVWDQTDDEYTAQDVEDDIQRFKDYYSKQRWGSYKNAISRYQTDLCVCQEIEVARLHKQVIDDVYMYYWHWPDYIDSFLPAMHASELYFLFNKPDALQPIQLDMHLNMVNRWSKFAYDSDPWDDAWNTDSFERKWEPFTTSGYEIYEIGDWDEMGTRVPGDAIPQSDSRATPEGCNLLMTIAKGHFKYRWSGTEDTDAQSGVTLEAWIEGAKLRFDELISLP